MLFNSLDFAVFFPVVAAVYFAAPHRARVPLLVVASCWFYMAFVPAYILILAFVILLDFAAGHLIGGAHGARRRYWLALSIVANLSVLGFFKYYNFIQGNVAAVATWFGQPVPFEALAIVLPIGLSFHTFQSMSYTIEVYRGRAPVERSLPHFACYVLFFPQLVAGPIERPQNLLTQFRQPHRFDLDRAFSGGRLIAIGLFKKVLVADRLAPWVDLAYAAPGAHAGSDLLLATYLFAVQIYCDFSGYSDMAIGTARILGIDLMENFNKPYAAATFSEFWRRWHISLSTWFRDYVYVPLGGNRVTFGRRTGNLLVVFALSGIWHGANWTFIIWGLLHGAFLVAELAVAPVANASRWRLPSVARFMVVFNLTCLAWVFFRASDATTAFDILWRIGTLAPGPGESVLRGPEFLLAIALAVGLLAIDAIGRARPVLAQLDARPRWQRWAAYYAFVLAAVALAVTAPSTTAKPFIYFQF